MKKIKLDADKMYCLVAAIIIIGSYAVQRYMSIFLPASRTMAIVTSIVMAVLVFIVCVILTKSRDSYYGMMTALIGIKMMPPTLSLADYAADLDVMYFLLQKVAIVAFCWMLIRFYREQDESKKIDALSVLGIVLIMPFADQISTRVGTYLYTISGSMLGVYCTQYAAYIVTTLVILFMALVSNGETAKFVAIYQYIALAINALRRCALITSLAIQHQHISKNLYCWIAIYALLALTTYLMNKSAQARALAEK